MKIKEREEKVANTILGLSRLQFLKNKLLTSTTIAKLVQISKETKFKILFHKSIFGRRRTKNESRYFEFLLKLIY